MLDESQIQTQIAAAIGGEHRVPVLATGGRRIGWTTSYVTGPEAEVLACAASDEVGSIIREALNGQRVAIVDKIEEMALAILSDPQGDDAGAPIAAAILRQAAEVARWAPTPTVADSHEWLGSGR